DGWDRLHLRAHLGAPQEPHLLSPVLPGVRGLVRLREADRASVRIAARLPYLSGIGVALPALLPVPHQPVRPRSAPPRLPGHALYVSPRYRHDAPLLSACGR